MVARVLDRSVPFKMVELNGADPRVERADTLIQEIGCHLKECLRNFLLVLFHRDLPTYVWNEQLASTF